jgi:hypothetical protein
MPFAIFRASSLVMRFAAARRPGWLSRIKPASRKAAEAANRVGKNKRARRAAETISNSSFMKVVVERFGKRL